MIGLSSPLRLLPFYAFWGSLAAFRLVFAQQTQNAVLNSGVDAFVNQLLTDWNSPGGVSVAVVRRDVNTGAWNVETKGYGIAKASGSKVTENTLFAIGSNTKLFTALATGLLINNESLSPRLSWTSKMHSVMPIWGLQDSTAAKQASIIDVMTHRSGLPRHDFAYKLSDDLPGMIKKMHFLRPSAEFRDVWQYDNNMYAVLSYFPSVLLPSKPPFARYVKQYILDPLGMTSTTFSFDKANSTGQLGDAMARDIVANGTVRVLPFWSTMGGEDGNPLSGPGGIISNAVDMATWLQTLLLNGVKPGTNQSVIPANAIRMVATGFSVENGMALFPELSPVVYGGGQQRSSYRGHEMIEHAGGVPGFSSMISRIPSDNLGIAVLSNDAISGALIMQIIRYRLLDEALGLEPIDWDSRFKTLTSQVPTPATPRATNASLPSVKFTSLAGTYTNAGYGPFELCFVSSNYTAASSSCKTLVDNASIILPGVVNASVPTYLAVWNSPLVSHISLTHYGGNIFNITILSSYPTGDPSKPFWVNANPGGYTTGVAEVATEGSHIGMGFTGFWGAGAGIPSPQGKTVRGRAEVWFDKA